MKVRKFRLDQFLAYLMVARFSCVALANIPIFSMKYIFIYGVLFIALYVANYKKLQHKEACALAALLLYTLFVVVKTSPSAGTIFNTQSFNAYVMVFLFFIYVYMKRIDIIEIKKISRIALVGYIFTYLYSIVMLIQNPALSRQAAANIVVEDNVDTLNAVGGFDTVYGTIILILLFIYLLKIAKDKKDVWLLRIGLISGIVFLVLASYGTAIIMLILLIIIVLMRKNKILCALVMGGSITLYIQKRQLGNWIYLLANKIGFSDILKGKIQDISMILITGKSAGTLPGDEERLARIEWDVFTFTKYPILGGMGKDGAKIGAHSEIFDTLARFGIVGFIFMLIFFICFFKDGVQQMDTRIGKQCLGIAIFLYIIIALLDPALYTQQILPFFVLVPFFDKIME